MILAWQLLADNRFVQLIRGFPRVLKNLYSRNKMYNVNYFMRKKIQKNSSLKFKPEFIYFLNKKYIIKNLKKSPIFVVNSPTCYEEILF